MHLIPWGRAPRLVGLIAIVMAGPLAAQSGDPAGPPHRRHHALTYDPATHRVLLFGGQHLVSNSEMPILDDLWSWDGVRWTEMAKHTGIAMVAHKLFADGKGGVFTAANAYGLTARWAASRWSPVVEDSMTRREMGAGGYDAGRDRFVLFGGHVGGRAFPTDTREFDGRQWNQVATEGPPAMLGGSMAYDSKRRVMVLFGGLDQAGQKFADTWEWDGTRWTKVASSGPPARFGAGMAYDDRRGEVVIFGGVGSDNQKLDDTWRWRDGRWERAAGGSGPSARSEGYLAYDARRQVIVLFGGEGAQTIPTLGDTWEWNGSRWTKVR